MFKIQDSIRNRLAVAATVFLGLLLLAGCSDPADAQASGAKDESKRQEVVLSVPDMSCPMCPVTVRRALKGIDGVQEADADLESKQARAVFDPVRTDPEIMIAAIRNAGFSATVKGERDE